MPERRHHGTIGLQDVLVLELSNFVSWTCCFKKIFPKKIRRKLENNVFFLVPTFCCKNFCGFVWVNLVEFLVEKKNTLLELWGRLGGFGFVCLA